VFEIYGWNITGEITTLKRLILPPAREYYHSVPAFLGSGGKITGNIPTLLKFFKRKISIDSTR
jgi:hypothetical protein